MKRLKRQHFRFNPQCGASGYKVRRSQREEMNKMLKKDKNTGLKDKIYTMRWQPLAIDVKGGGRTGKVYANRKSVFPSMPKGETVGNVGIDGKGEDKSNT